MIKYDTATAVYRLSVYIGFCTYHCSIRIAEVGVVSTGNPVTSMDITFLAANESIFDATSRS